MTPQGDMGPLEVSQEPPALAPSRMSFGFLLKIAASIAILCVLFWKFRGDMSSIRNISIPTLVATVILLLLQPPLIGIRWWLILRIYGEPPPMRTLIETTWIAIFANQFLPASVGGDAIRIYYARMLTGSLGLAFTSVFIDRVMAMLALTMLVVVLSPTLADLIDRRVVAALALAIVLGLVAAAVFFKVVSNSRNALRWPLPEKVRSALEYSLRIMAHPFHGLAAFAISVLIHLFSFAALLFIGRDMSIDANILPFLGIASIMTFVQVVPITIAGWGVREATAVTLFGLIGVNSGTAFVASIVLGLAYTVASLPGAVIWLYRRQREPGHGG